MGRTWYRRASNPPSCTGRQVCCPPRHRWHMVGSNRESCWRFIAYLPRLVADKERGSRPAGRAGFDRARGQPGPTGAAGAGRAKEPGTGGNAVGRGGSPLVGCALPGPAGPAVCACGAVVDPHRERSVVRVDAVAVDGDEHVVAVALDADLDTEGAQHETVGQLARRGQVTPRARLPDGGHVVR